ncbi:MAG: hypothetical protein ACQEUG_17735 [Pseudomonadota bacterium]
MKTYLLSEILESACEHALKNQKEDGSFPGGHNGPYKDIETPARNTAHYLFLIAAVGGIDGSSGPSRYEAAKKAVSYLFSTEIRPNSKTIHIRTKQGKDHCNGVVGQAWIIEALVAAANAFSEPDWYTAAEKLFLLHPWDKDACLWYRVEPDGAVLSPDSTFNHQLWFAAAASMLHETPLAQDRAYAFLTCVAARVQTYSNGIIKHNSPMRSVGQGLKKGWERGIVNVKNYFKNSQYRDSVYQKSVGYHGFNIYAYAMLKRAFPDHPFWLSRHCNHLLEPVINDGFEADLDESIFSWNYNVTGIEFSLAVETFLNDKELGERWLNKQFKRTWLSNKEPMAKSATDRNTANARLYEATRLKSNYRIQVSND